MNISWESIDHNIYRATCLSCQVAVRNLSLWARNVYVYFIAAHTRESCKTLAPMIDACQTAMWSYEKGNAVLLQSSNSMLRTFSFSLNDCLTNHCCCSIKSLSLLIIYFLLLTYSRHLMDSSNERSWAMLLKLETIVFFFKRCNNFELRCDKVPEQTLENQRSAKTCTSCFPRID